MFAPVTDKRLPRVARGWEEEAGLEKVPNNPNLAHVATNWLHPPCGADRKEKEKWGQRKVAKKSIIFSHSGKITFIT